MQGAENGRVHLLPNVAKEFAPAQFVDELVLYIERLAFAHAFQYLLQGHEAVRDIGREAAYRAIKRISAACIGVWLDRSNAGIRRRRVREEPQRAQDCWQGLVQARRYRAARFYAVCTYPTSLRRIVAARS